MYSTGRCKLYWQLLLCGPPRSASVSCLSCFPPSWASLGSWGLKLSAWSLVPPQLWRQRYRQGYRQGYRQIWLSLLMFLLLWESREAVGGHLHNSVCSLTEKYARCKSDAQRNKSRGGEGCPEPWAREGLSLSEHSVWTKRFGRDTWWPSTKQICPCDDQESVCARVLPCVKWHQN